MPPVNFRLMFPISDVDQWAKNYPPHDDDAAFEAGRKIRAGDYARANLDEIVRWKSRRRAALIAQNSDAEIADALRLALLAKEPRSALAVLTGLKGVGLPMASAILTALDQETYTVIDLRALQALGAPDLDVDINFYVREYLPACKRLAAEAGVGLRTFDRALWAWSKGQDKVKGARVGI